jgi:glycosyltransferase involved in cell wall biosynthesis
VGLKRILDQLQPDILYAILLHANALATLTLPFLNHRPKFIQSIHTLQPSPAWHWTLQGILAPYADAIIAPSDPILTKIAAHGPFTRGTVIPNGIDIDRFANAIPIPPADLPWPSDAPAPPVIGYIGRFDPVKNLPLLLRAFARTLTAHATNPHHTHPHFRPPHLALVGYGPQEQTLRNLAISLHIAPHVHFIPPTNTPERWYKTFTCHALPSAVEGFGLTVVEAMAAGIPVVVIDTPVYTAMCVHHFGGLLSSPDEISLSHALHQVITQNHPQPHPASQAPISPPKPTPEALHFLQTHFSVRKMVELHEEFFKNF